jgi:hypothetical protein
MGGEREAVIVPHTVFKGEQARENARVRRERLRAVRVTVLEQDGIPEETIKLRGIDFRISVGGQVVSAECIDGHKDERRVGAVLTQIGSAIATRYAQNEQAGHEGEQKLLPAHPHAAEPQARSIGIPSHPQGASFQAIR